MNITDMLYTLIVFPLEKILEISFITFRRLLSSGWALIGISGVITLLTLPLYLVADKWQRVERKTAARLKTKAAKIRAVFSGDEQYLILSTYYRQNHYHPIYALRSSLGLLVQIPFFIAAYHYLSRAAVLKGESFFWIDNLAAPDVFFPSFPAFHLLPVLMTLFNALSAVIYTRGFPLREKLQLYAAAAVFLVLLYNSPSAMVLYWTMNNVFSLLKNIIQKCKRPLHILYVLLCVLAAAIDLYLFVFFSSGYYTKRILLAAVVSSVFFAPFFLRGAKALEQIFKRRSLAAVLDWKTFAFSALILFLFAALAVPSSLIASSVQEFSFLGGQDSPLPYLFQTALQGAGFFLLWPLAVFFLFSPRIRAFLAAALTLFAVFALADAYLFPGDYGFLTISLGLSNAVFKNSPLSLFLQITAILALCALFFFLLFRAHRRFLLGLQVILILALTLLASFNFVKIGRDFLTVADAAAANKEESYRHLFRFSASPQGRNVVILMLDRAISGYAGEIFREYPELEAAFSGFIRYPNCVSFGPITLFGAPPLFGGYEYTPGKLAISDGRPLVEKHNESLLMLPRLFSEHGYEVSVTDPTWANYSWKPDLSIYNGYPGIQAQNIIGRYSSDWLRKNPDAKVFDAPAFLKKNLILFSFFKAAPPFLRFFVYDDGKWLSNIIDSAENEMPLVTLDEFTALDYLPLLTKIDRENFNSFAVIVNQLTHEPAIIDPPLSVKQGPRSASPDYQVNVAALTLLARWFTKLQNEGAWDNTRIIIAADHGWNLSDMPFNFHLPSGESLMAYNPLFMVKDFNASEPLAVDGAFMTHADTAAIAVDGIITGARNPFTGAPIVTAKEDGVTITTSHRWSPDHHHRDNFRIEDDQWLHVRDDIFNPGNWTREKPR
ncbi:MAG: YidC/Oxa1 family membrane protein insertase [Treponema sp.]|jgi:YidC/Oxa1 family membrane protein insertase|nr:YidC/Oxa1 family membrane protein insertase [Treponema sp.]